MAGSPVELAGDRPGLPLGEHRGDLGGRADDVVLVDAAHDHLGREARLAQHARAHGRRGGEHEAAGHPTRLVDRRWALSGCAGRDASCASQAATNAGWTFDSVTQRRDASSDDPDALPVEPERADDHGHERRPPPRRRRRGGRTGSSSVGSLDGEQQQRPRRWRSRKASTERSRSRRARAHPLVGRLAHGQLGRAAARARPLRLTEMTISPSQPSGPASSSEPGDRRGRPGSRSPASRPSESRVGTPSLRAHPGQRPRAPRRPRTPSRSPCREATLTADGRVRTAAERRR